jgi:UDP-galactopyranose mutase
MTEENDVRDRLRRRFDDDDSPNEEMAEEENAQTSNSSKNEKASKNEMNRGNAMLAENVKKEWTATSVYLPDFLQRRLTTRYKRLDLDFEEEYNQSLPKTRYYYPLVVALGIEQLEEMDATEIKERMEQMEDEAEQ